MKNLEQRVVSLEEEVVVMREAFTGLCEMVNRDGTERQNSIDAIAKKLHTVSKLVVFGDLG